MDIRRRGILIVKLIKQIICLIQYITAKQPLLNVSFIKKYTKRLFNNLGQFGESSDIAEGIECKLHKWIVSGAN